MTKLLALFLTITLLAFATLVQADTHQQKPLSHGPDFSGIETGTLIDRPLTYNEVHSIALMRKYDPKRADNLVSAFNHKLTQIERVAQSYKSLVAAGDNLDATEKVFRSFPINKKTLALAHIEHQVAVDLNESALSDYRMELLRKHGASEKWLMARKKFIIRTSNWITKSSKRREKNRRDMGLPKKPLEGIPLELKRYEYKKKTQPPKSAAVDNKVMRKEDIKKKRTKPEETNTPRRQGRGTGRTPKPEDEDDRIVEADEGGMLTGKALRLSDLEGCGASMLKFDWDENMGFASTPCPGLTGGRVATKADYLTYCNSFDRPRGYCGPPGPGTEKRIERSGIQGMPFSVFCLGLHFNILASKGDVFNNAAKAGKLVSVFKYDNGSRKLECYYVSFAQSKVLRDRYKNIGTVVKTGPIKGPGPARPVAKAEPKKDCKLGGGLVGAMNCVTERIEGAGGSGVKNADAPTDPASPTGKGRPRKNADRSPASASSTDPETGITTTSVRNPDGSRTVTKTGKDGEILSREKVLTNPDGSRRIAKSKETVDADGTGHSVKMDEDGNRIKSTITPDGVVTTKKTDDYGNTTETVLNKDGTLTSVEKTVTGYTTETTRETDGQINTVKKDLDGSVTQTIEKYPDGATVTTDRHGNSVEVSPPNDAGETMTVRVDKKGNEKLVITDDKGETIYQDETRVTPKEAGREYYETVLGGDAWDDLPRSSKTRYADSERRARNNLEVDRQRQAREQDALRRKQLESEQLAKSHEKLDSDLAAIKAEQSAADAKAAERKANKARKLKIQASYDKADKLQQQYDEAIERGDKKAAKRVERLQDKHEQASMEILEFTEDEKKRMENKTALRQELMNQIKREATFAALKEDLERTQNDPYKDVAMEGASYLSIGAEQQRDLAKSNRKEDRLLSYTDNKNKAISRLLSKKDLTPDERDILTDLADMSGLQRDGALEKKAANDRIVAAGYAIDAAMLVSGGVGNLAASVGTKVVGKAVAVKVATKVFAKNVARGVATKTAVKKALKTGAKIGEKFSDKLMKFAQHDLKTAASKKIIEKVVAKQTAKKILTKKLAEGVAKEVAEKAARKIGERAGKKVATELGKEISEKGLINTAGSKAGGNIVERLAGKQTGKAVEKALAKKRSIVPEAVKKLVKGPAAKEPTQAPFKTAARPPARTPPGRRTARPDPNKTLPPPGQRTARPDPNKTLPPPGRRTARPDPNKTLPPPGQRTARPDPNKTLPPPGRRTARLGPEATAPTKRLGPQATAPTKPLPLTAKPVPKKISGATTILDDPLKGAVGRRGSTEIIKATKNTGVNPKPFTGNKAPKYPKNKKPSEMTPVQRQAHNDARAQEVVSKKWKDKAPLEDGGSDILPSPTGKPTDLPVGELSRDLTPKQIENLFKPGANLTSKQIQQKADLFLKRRMDARARVSTGGTGKTLPPPGRRTARPDPNKTLPPPGRRTARLNPNETLPPPTQAASPVGKNSVMPKSKVGGIPKENVGGMPKGKVGGLPEGKAGAMPEGKVGGLAGLSKGYPRGMPDGKVGGLLDRNILKGQAGKKVTDPRPFGMLPRVMKSIQKNVNQADLKLRIRAANDSAIAKLRAGHPPKHVKLKSKTINDLDVQLGAPPGSQGEVGYFKPKQPKNPSDKLLRRYKQRLKEYSDNFRDIQKLKDQGLVTVENGVVIDRGLSNTRLGKNGKLIVDRKGPAGGTGKGFTGDHDMWDITHPDGRPIVTNPKAPGFDANALRRKVRLQENLDRGLAQTQHGPHKDWVPITHRDIGIDKKIRASHNPGGEALLEFAPNQPPRTSYELGEAGKPALQPASRGKASR